MMYLADPYDSLEEDSTISGATLNPPDSPRLKKIQPADISTILPLYGKETFKKDVRINKAKSTVTRIPTKIKPTRAHDPPNPLPDGRSSNKTKIYSMTSLNGLGSESRPKRSYLDMFRAKIGWTKAVGSETTRGVMDENTFRSPEGSINSDNSSVFSDAKSFVSDSSSFYFKFMHEEQLRREAEESRAFSQSCDSKTTLSSQSVLNMKSVSEVSSLQTQPKLPRSKSVKLNKSLLNMKSVSEVSSLQTQPKSPRSKSVKLNKSLLNVPVLGTLGPDPVRVKEKMVKLKRQQSYGQKASNQNRIKMLEKNVIRNFELELKKSNEIQKCANIVLSAK